MEKITIAIDMEGRKMMKGDTVTTVAGDLTARIADLAREGEEEFVRLRPLHQPYGPGVWHAANRVIWVAAGKQRKKQQKEAREKAAAEKS